MTPAETTRRVLTVSPGEAFCDSCLALAGSTSPAEIREVTGNLLIAGDFQRRDRCDSCHRTVPAIAYAPKCAHCSYPIGPRQTALVSGGDVFHAVCVRVLVSEDAIRTSRNLTEESQRLVERARRQIDPRRPEPRSSNVASIDTERVRRILIDAPGNPLCDPCLAAAAQLSLDQIRAATASLLTNQEEFKRGFSCAGCHRSLTSILYRAKCAHCDVRLHDADKGFRMGEEIFHVVCLRRLISDDDIPVSRAFGRRCRRLIDQARRRMRRGYEGPLLESP